MQLTMFIFVLPAHPCVTGIAWLAGSLPNCLTCLICVNARSQTVIPSCRQHELGNRAYKQATQQHGYINTVAILARETWRTHPGVYFIKMNEVPSEARLAKLTKPQYRNLQTWFRLELTCILGGGTRTFPASLTPAARRCGHAVASGLGLDHTSTGSDSSRQFQASGPQRRARATGRSQTTVVRDIPTAPALSPLTARIQPKLASKAAPPRPSKCPFCDKLLIKRRLCPSTACRVRNNQARFDAVVAAASSHEQLSDLSAKETPTLKRWGSGILEEPDPKKHKEGSGRKSDSDAAWSGQSCGVVASSAGSTTIAVMASRSESRSETEAHMASRSEKPQGGEALDSWDATIPDLFQSSSSSSSSSSCSSSSSIGVHDDSGPTFSARQKMFDELRGIMYGCARCCGYPPNNREVFAE